MDLISHLRYLLLLALCTLFRGGAFASETVVVFFGDSTTAARPPTRVYADLLAESLLRDRGAPLKVVNAGVRGDTTRKAAERFERDVLAHRPQLVVIQFGINDATTDVWKNPPETAPRVSLADYRANLATFIATCRARNIRIVLMTPNVLRWSERTLSMYGRPPYNRDDPDGLNLNLRSYAAAMRELAVSTGTPLVDIMVAHDAALVLRSASLTSDGVHPNDEGHRLVAELLAQILKRHPDLLGTNGTSAKTE